MTQAGITTRNVALLGSTGSIGCSALRVAGHLPDRIRVVGVAGGTQVELLAAQARTHGPEWAYIADSSGLERLSAALPRGCTPVTGEEALCDLVSAPGVDIVLCAIVGVAGLRPVLSAIRAGKDIALASKEILVMAGELVMAEAARHGVRVLPVDSEHSALFQCLDGKPSEHVRRLVLTASGGPFRDTPAAELRTITPEQALNHPTWSMGSKVTVDSATLMNKGLELIEACRLFGMGPDRIQAVIHPQSIVHSMVEFVDGSVFGQLGYPDMCLPIQYALTYPERHECPVRYMDFTAALELGFFPPDHQRFPALRLARQAVEVGGTGTAVFNAANEVAVELFLERRLSFPGISHVVEATMASHDPVCSPTLGEILDADEWARSEARASAVRIGVD